MNQQTAKKENPFVSIIFNIVIPTYILSKHSGESSLGPVNGLLVATLFPLLYGAYDYVRRKKHNFISILGLVSVVLSGGLGLLKLDGFWFAVKEATIPGLIGLTFLASLKTSKPLVKLILYNDTMMHIDKVNEKLNINQSMQKFEKLLFSTTFLLSLSFFLSAVLNFGLAQYLLKSPAGTEAFNQELAKMTALSFPVIAVPSTIVTGLALWYLMNGIKKLTGLTMEDVMKIS